MHVWWPTTTPAHLLAQLQLLRHRQRQAEVQPMGPPQSGPHVAVAQTLLQLQLLRRRQAGHHVRQGVPVCHTCPAAGQQVQLLRARGHVYQETLQLGAAEVLRTGELRLEAAVGAGRGGVS
jgi:hypothetical protein